MLVNYDNPIKFLKYQNLNKNLINLHCMKKKQKLPNVYELKNQPLAELYIHTPSSVLNSSK